jgi:hypothetical protein
MVTKGTLQAALWDAKYALMAFLMFLLAGFDYLSGNEWEFSAFCSIVNWQLAVYSHLLETRK